MADVIHRYLVTRATLLRDSIPTTLCRRATRRGFAVPRQFHDHLSQARQLYAYVRTPAERKLVDDLMVEIENGRIALATKAELFQQEMLDKLQQCLRAFR